MSTPDADVIRTQVMQMAADRGAGKTFCPSEVARALGGAHPDGWGPLMIPVRRAAVALADEGLLIVYRKGKPVDPHNFKGVYRLGLPYSE